jgi:acetylornithine deacetylase/succinyl-diaminopimelate desuccinylase-like protein
VPDPVSPLPVPDPTTSRPASPSVVELCSRLLSFDSSNYGSAGSNGERETADYVVDVLHEAGYHPTLLESAPTRANVLLRVPGNGDPRLSALLVHGHLDVVPAEADQWSVDPFSGLVQDGFVWGRGATDMKDAVAVSLRTLLDWAETGRGPRRDIVFAFVADEEEDGAFGAEWLVANHPDWFTGVEAAIGESGGTPVQVRDRSGTLRRLYPVATAERGTLHMTLRAEGESGHGSRPAPDSAVVKLVETLSRIVGHRWPITLPPAGHAFLEGATAALGLTSDLSTEEGVAAALHALGDELGEFVRPASRCSVNPTALRAGYKVNVVPGFAEADLDVRTVPGLEDALLTTIESLLSPGVSRRFISNHPGVSAPIESLWFGGMRRALLAHDPDGVVVPFCMGGGTDAKAFSKLGIDCYGFAPLGRDPEGRAGSGMHGIDERVPVAALEAGVGILDTFLTQV